MSHWPAVSLEPVRVVLGPGDDVAVTVAVTNTGDIVEHYTVDVLGLPPGQRAEIEPSVAKLRPGESGQLTVRLGLSAQAPPAAATLVLGVRVRSIYRPDVSRAEELRLKVLPVPGLFAHADPEVVSGSRGTYQIALRNDGNTGLDVALTGSDPEKQVALTFTPPRVFLEPGGAVTADLVAAAKRPVSGPETRRQITVLATAGAKQVTVGLTLVQRPRIPAAVSRLGTSAGGLLVVVAALFGATTMVTKALASTIHPQPTSAGTGPVPTGSSSTPAPSPTVTATATAMPTLTPSPTLSPTESPGIAGTGTSGTPALDLDLTTAPNDSRTDQHVIDPGGYPGVVLSAVPSSSHEPACAQEKSVQFEPGPAGGFVGSGSGPADPGSQTGSCTDLPVLIQFATSVTTVTVTVRSMSAADDPPATITYGIIAATATGSAVSTRTLTVVSGVPGRPLKLTWTDPAGIDAIIVGGSPSYQGTITALQHITAG